MNEKTGAEIHDLARSASLVIDERVGPMPTIAVVLGSGMGDFVTGMTDRRTLPYTEIPGFPETRVPGHHGNIVVGQVGGVEVVALQGRFHYYEGHALSTVTLPVRVLSLLGVRTLILTAATGGIREDLGAGDLVILTDHLNLIGENPLRGPNDDRMGPRFPDMTEVYSARLHRIAREVSRIIEIDVKDGVYACLPGPSYETPAEVRMLRTLGADVVGMSTVPEAIVARHCGMDVVAFAIVANAAAGISDTPITHEEVLLAVAQAGPRLAMLITELVARIPPP